MMTLLTIFAFIFLAALLCGFVAFIIFCIKVGWWVLSALFSVFGIVIIIVAIIAAVLI